MDKELIDRINNIYWKYNLGAQMVKKPRDLAVLTSYSSFGKNNKNGPIGVAKCLFNKEKVTLIMLGGTQFREGQATTFKESKLSMKGKDNDYLDAVLDVFNNNVISKKEPVIISGISLGGMIAQQILSKVEITNNYNIKSIICFGSPIVNPVDRKGIRVIRFTDKGDIVPKLGKFTSRFHGINNKIRKKLDNEERILEDGNYKKTIESHALSYVECVGFDKYDFYGVLNGKNTLEILEDIKYYDAKVK